MDTKWGGHAIAGIGYIYGYRGIDSKTKKLITGESGSNVIVMQNSYGKDWGASFIDDKGQEHSGCFFVDMSYFERNNLAMMVNLDDIDKELGKFLNDYDGANVQAKGRKAIFHIQKGKKKLYPNWETYLSWNGQRKGFVEIDGKIIDKVPDGENMDITKSDYWVFLKSVKEANRLDALLELLNKK